MKHFLEYNVAIQPGMPFIIPIDPDSWLVPFGVRTLQDCPWVDHVIIRSLADLKEDVKYSNTSELKSTHIERSMFPADKYRMLDELSKETEWIEFHEIRDAKTREIMAHVYVGDGGNIIRGPSPDLLQLEGLPFVDLCFVEDPEYYWGTSDAGIMEPQQLELNEARTQAMKHRRIALIKFLIRREGMTVEEADKLLEETVGACVFVDGNPADIVMSLQPHIPPDLLSWVEAIVQDTRVLMGFGRQEMGELQQGNRTTATESSFVHAAKELRMSERRDILADTMVLAMRKINQIVFDRWDEEHVAQVLGYDGAKYWVKYTGMQLRQEYDIKVDVESMAPSSKDIRRQDLVSLIQALSANPRANLDYLMRLLIQQYDWIDAMKVLPEAPESAAQPMGMDQFSQIQGKVLTDSNYRQGRVQSNAKMLGAPGA
jgi:hypothetical protein